MKQLPPQVGPKTFKNNLATKYFTLAFAEVVFIWAFQNISIRLASMMHSENLFTILALQSTCCLVNFFSNSDVFVVLKKCVQGRAFNRRYIEALYFHRKQAINYTRMDSLLDVPLSEFHLVLYMHLEIIHDCCYFVCFGSVCAG